jgi:hypothetical protein
MRDTPATPVDNFSVDGCPKLLSNVLRQPGTWVCSDSYPFSGDIGHQQFELEHFRWLRACAAATFAGSVKAPCKTSHS